MAAYHYFVDDTKKLVRRVDATLRALDEHFPKARTLVVCGVSGMAVAAPVAYARRLGLAVIRKEGEVAYSMEDSWPHGAVGQCVMLDDVVHAGNTVRRMLSRSVVRPSGLILYECLGFTSSTETRRILNEPPISLPVEFIAQGVWWVRKEDEE